MKPPVKLVTYPRAMSSKLKPDRLLAVERTDKDKRSPSADRRRGSEIVRRKDDEERHSRAEKDADRKHSDSKSSAGSRTPSGTVREVNIERKYRLAQVQLLGPDELPASLRRAGGDLTHYVLIDVLAPLYFQSAALLADLGYEQGGGRDALRSSGESSSSASSSSPSLTWQLGEATLVSASSISSQGSPLPDELQLRVRASALPPVPLLESSSSATMRGRHLSPVGGANAVKLGGWLRLYASQQAKWRRLFCILHGTRLTYFKKAPASLDDPGSPEGVIQLDERAYAKEVKPLSPTALLDSALAGNKETKKLEAFIELHLSTGPILLSLSEIDASQRRQWLQSLCAQPRVFGARLASFAAPPPLFQEMIDYLSQPRCLTTEGIFRMSGSASRIEKYVEQYNKGEAVDLAAEKDPHTVAGLLRLWVRELNEPLLTEALYADWTGLAKIPDARLQLLATLALVARLPPVHRECLARIFELFAQVVENESVNKMGIGNLATVFGSNLLRIPPAQAANISEAKAVNAIVVILYDFHTHLFHRLPLPRRRAALVSTLGPLPAEIATTNHARGLQGLTDGTEIDVLLLPFPDASYFAATTRDGLRYGLVPASALAFLPRPRLPSWAEAQVQRCTARQAALTREKELLGKASKDAAAHSVYRSSLCSRAEAWLSRHAGLRPQVAALCSAAAVLSKAQRAADRARQALLPVLEPAQRAALQAAEVEKEAAVRAAQEGLLQPVKEAVAPAIRLPDLLTSLRAALVGPVASASLRSHSLQSAVYATPIPPAPAAEP